MCVCVSEQMVISYKSQPTHESGCQFGGDPQSGFGFPSDFFKKQTTKTSKYQLQKKRRGYTVAQATPKRRRRRADHRTAGNRPVRSSEGQRCCDLLGLGPPARCASHPILGEGSPK